MNRQRLWGGIVMVFVIAVIGGLLWLRFVALPQPLHDDAAGPVYAAPGGPADEFEAQIRETAFRLCKGWSLAPLAERLDSEATWPAVAAAYASGYPDEGNNRQAAIEGCMRGGRQ